MPRLILVSNRLPVVVTQTSDRVAVTPSAGGLATGLRGYHERSGGLWVGWPGDVSGLTDEQRAAVDTQLGELRAVPLHLTSEEVEQYYEGYSNEVLWPLFHYLLDRVPLFAKNWAAYQAVNQRFADLVVAHHQPDDQIWIHDYQLMLVPMMIRKRLPSARIGFFLHIPFPADEVLRVLPRRREILDGLLGADLVGFHTFAYARHFARSLSGILGTQANVDSVGYEGRHIEFNAFPMGIDAAAIASLAASPPVEEALQKVTAERAGRRILLGVDRLDYTKGIPRRLLALERLLETEPMWRGQIELVQLAVPSRTKIGEYEEIRRSIDQLVGRINGAFSTVTWTPIHYLYRAVSPEELVTMYRSADVMLVTPLRDGMNLVAKEYVASRIDESGVLVLSEFAGAASELGEALLVNPYDVEGTAATMHRALLMSAEEGRIRMRALRERVTRHDVHAWAEDFLHELERRPTIADARLSSPDELAALVARLREAPSLALLLDYDGTLVPIADSPELAAPDEELRRLLVALAARPRTRVHMVTGRSRADVERWFGDLPIGLHAEHGLWSRLEPGASWSALRAITDEWKVKLHPILQSFTDRTPGSLIEEKTATLAWHYRITEADFGERQAKELLLHLEGLLSNAPVEVVTGAKVIEVRLHGVDKGKVVPAVLATFDAPPLLMAMGNDLTDEDLFRALPTGSVAVQVGLDCNRGTHRLADSPAALALLRSLLRP